jgi:ferredoxin
MDAVLSTARSRGWPEPQLHYEFFSADVAPSATDESFEVQVASSGRIVVVPKDKTVVQALADAGIEVQTSCEQGVCGTCITRVLEGEPDHKDLYFTPEEQARNDSSRRAARGRRASGWCWIFESMGGGQSRQVRRSARSSTQSIPSLREGTAFARKEFSDASPGQPHTSRAVSTTSASFCRCTSTWILLPCTVLEKPHCGDSASCSSGA